jgi:hypothetical protein
VALAEAVRQLPPGVERDVLDAAASRSGFGFGFGSLATVVAAVAHQEAAVVGVVPDYLHGRSWRPPEV